MALPVARSFHELVDAVWVSDSDQIVWTDLHNEIVGARACLIIGVGTTMILQVVDRVCAELVQTALDETEPAHSLLDPSFVDEIDSRLAHVGDVAQTDLLGHHVHGQHLHLFRHLTCDNIVGVQADAVALEDTDQLLVGQPSHLQTGA